jgi:hypothetical protein
VLRRNNPTKAGAVLRPVDFYARRGLCHSVLRFLRGDNENAKYVATVFSMLAKVAIGDLFCAVFAGLFDVRIH